MVDARNLTGTGLCVQVLVGFFISARLPFPVLFKVSPGTDSEVGFFAYSGPESWGNAFYTQLVHPGRESQICSCVNKSYA